jgi:hypothetical protein
MFDSFIKSMKIAAVDTILDVGVRSDRSYDHFNYLEAWYPHKSHITAVGINNATSLQLRCPGVKFVRADGPEFAV